MGLSIIPFSLRVEYDKSRKTDKVILTAELGLRLVKSLSRKARYNTSLLNEGNTIVEVEVLLGDVGRQIESGRTIGITCRNHVRKRVSPDFLIAGFNLRGVLKPKGN